MCTVNALVDINVYNRVCQVNCELIAHCVLGVIARVIACTCGNGDTVIVTVKSEGLLYLCYEVAVSADYPPAAFDLIGSFEVKISQINAFAVILTLFGIDVAVDLSYTRLCILNGNSDLFL